MPFQSDAQKRKFALMAHQGKIPMSMFYEWMDATGKKKLPDRVKHTDKGGKKT